MQSVLLLVAIILFIAGALGVMLTRMTKLKGTYPLAGTISMWLAVIGILLYLLALYVLPPPEQANVLMMWLRT